MSEIIAGPSRITARTYEEASPVSTGQEHLVFLGGVDDRLKLESRQVTVVDGGLRNRQVIPDVRWFDAGQ